MTTNRKLIVFCGGGTAGHVYPAFPVINRVKQAGFDVLWIGSNSGMERRLVERGGVPFLGIPAGKFRRYFSFKNFVDLFRILGGIFVSWRLLKRLKPVLLFSKGGFVSVPPVAAARFLRIPAFTHESDADPGLATRLNIRLGATVLVSYDSTLKYLAENVRENARVTGNPVRDSLLGGSREAGRRIVGLQEDDKRPLILVLGGSLGAREVNNLIEACVENILPLAAIVHQTGDGNLRFPSKYGYFRQSFFNDEMPDLLAAADLAISRAGAGTLWELAATGTPAIFIPLRGATRGDQLLNAALAEKVGMALVLEDGADSKLLSGMIIELLSDVDRLGDMASAAASIPAAEAADRICNILLEATR